MSSRRAKDGYGIIDAAAARKLMDTPVAGQSNLHCVLLNQQARNSGSPTPAPTATGGRSAVSCVSTIGTIEPQAGIPRSDAAAGDKNGGRVIEFPLLGHSRYLRTPNLKPW